MKIYQNISNLYSQKDFNLIKMGLFLVKKGEFQLIICMIIPTRFLEMILNPSRCTGIKDNSDHILNTVLSVRRFLGAGQFAKGQFALEKS